MEASMSASSLPRYDLFVAGRPMPSASGKTYETVNPYTGKPWAVIPDGGADDGRQRAGETYGASISTMT